MRVLGITPSSTDVSWAIVEGIRSTPVMIPLNKPKQKFPKNQDESLILHNLYTFALSFLRDQSVNKVVILQAGNSMYGRTSSRRIKVEAVFQLTCVELNIPVEIVIPQKLRAQEKKFQTETGNTSEHVLNNGQDFKPKTWKNTVLVAWIGLDA